MIIMIVLIIVLNLWVWIFPNSYLAYTKLSKGAKIESFLPSQKEFQKIYENPKYIWYVRASLGFALLVAVCFHFFIG